MDEMALGWTLCLLHTPAAPPKCSIYGGGSKDQGMSGCQGLLESFPFTPQWIFSCCSGAASIFTNNLYFHIALLPGPSLELAPSSCKQGGWCRQGGKFGVPFPSLQCSERAKFPCCVFITSCTLVMGGPAGVCAVRAPWGHAAAEHIKT